MDISDNFELKKRLWELLYAYPMTDYATDHRMEVAICGDAYNCLEAFKAVYSLGQAVYIDEESEKPAYYELIINIFVEDPVHFKYLVNDVMPGFLYGVDNSGNPYAQMNFCSLSEKQTGNRFNNYSYYICFDDVPFSFTNKDALKASFQNEEAGFLVTIGELSCLVPAETHDELNRLNLNQKYTNILARENWESFQKAVDNQKKEENSRIKDGMFNPNNNYDSSFACTAHIPYKLAIFGDDRNKSIEALADILSKPKEEKQSDVRYKALIMLEHRRWNAYMISVGSIAPDPDLFSKYAYEGENTHKFTIKDETTGKSLNYHPCICDGGSDPFYLYNHPGCWNDKNFENSKELSDLDKFSIRNRNLCRERAAEILTGSDLQELKKEVADQKSPFLNKFLRIALNFVESEEYKDKFLYDYYFKTKIKGSSEAEEAVAKKIDKFVSIFKVRNEKKDYYLLDVNIIDGLYFDLWHLKKYQTVIVPCTGRAIEDIALSVSLSCSNIILLFNNANMDASKDEEKCIREFFSNRNSIAAIKLITEYANFNNAEEITNCVQQWLSDSHYEKDAIAIDCSTYSNGIVSLVIGSMVYNNDNIALLQYKGGEIIDCRTQKSISCGIHRCFSILEYLTLYGADYQNETEHHPTTNEEIKLFEIFREFSQGDVYESEAGKTQYTVWPSLAGVFTGFSKNLDVLSFFGINEDEKDYSQIKDLLINPDIFSSFAINELLNKLESCRIITNYKLSDKSIISFDSPGTSNRDKDLLAFFNELAKCTREMTTDEKIIEFAGYAENHPLRLLDNRVSGISVEGNPLELCSKDEKSYIKKRKVEFINALVNEGLISNINEEPLMQVNIDEKVPIYLPSFEFSSVQVKCLFQTAGKIFEHLLTQKIKELGIFSQIKNGVKIAWDNSHSWNYSDELEAYFEYLSDSSYGFNTYLNAKKYIKESSSGCTENEIDIILMNNMQATFISCKTGTNIKNEWLYEIASISNHFNAKPVLAVSFSLSDRYDNNLTQIKRAKSMGISLFGAETIYDSSLLKNCMKNIANREVISILI